MKIENETGSMAIGFLMAMIGGIINGLSPVLQRYAPEMIEISVPYNPLFLLGISFMIVGGIVMFVGLSHGKASVVFATFQAGTQVATLISAWAVTSVLTGVTTEPITLLKAVGIGLIVAGVALLGTEEHSGSE